MKNNVILCAYTKYEQVMTWKGGWQMNECVPPLLLKFVSHCACGAGFAVTVMFCRPAELQVQARSELMSTWLTLRGGRLYCVAEGVQPLEKAATLVLPFTASTLPIFFTFTVKCTTWPNAVDAWSGVMDGMM